MMSGRCGVCRSSEAHFPDDGIEFCLDCLMDEMDEEGLPHSDPRSWKECVVCKDLIPPAYEKERGGNTICSVCLLSSVLYPERGEDKKGGATCH